MAIILTKYIYPLENEVSFFEPLGLIFDNPRTEAEKQIIKEFLSKTLQFENKSFDKDNSEQSLRLLFGIGELRKYLELNDRDGYALKYYVSNPEKKLIDILAETWIVVRFKENDEFEKFIEDRDYLFDLIINRRSNSYSDRFREIQNFSHVVSLIANDEGSDFHGQSFILTKNPYDIFYSIERHEVHDVLEHFKDYNFLLQHENRVKSWLFWLDGKELLLKSAHSLNSICVSKVLISKNQKKRLSQIQAPYQKIKHVGNHLRMAYSHVSDPELMLILLVGIIEYLLTRNPDTNRFNVEDSITKQFKLKCAIAINASSKEWTLEQLNESLAEIYNQRSNIAHGNYVENYSQERTAETVLQVYQYLRTILTTYINNRGLIDYLKDN